MTRSIFRVVYSFIHNQEISVYEIYITSDSINKDRHTEEIEHFIKNDFKNSGRKVHIIEKISGNSKHFKYEKIK